MLEAESSKLKILADEGEKMRASLNNVNLQLMKLKNENRKLQKKSEIHHICRCLKVQQRWQ